MNRRIKREWIRCGGKGKERLPMRNASQKLLYLLVARNTRRDLREKEGSVCPNLIRRT